jgi:hypothetical protein
MASGDNTALLTRPAGSAVPGPRARRANFGVQLLGSLQVAVVLLPALALALGLGTWVEAAYDSRVAHQLVYGTWWFVTLLALLWANILCAAVKKWPWQKHQTGFLVTHVGLLTLVAGGLLTSLAGVRGVMSLVDTEDVRYHRFGVPMSNRLIDPQRDVIRVRLPDVRAEAAAYSFEPGPFAWHPAAAAQEPALASMLDRVAHPWPRSWGVDLGRGWRLEVLDYVPRAQAQPFAPAPAGSDAFPALAVTLSAPATGVLPPQWLGFHGNQRSQRLGPGLVEIIGRWPRAEQVAEFRQPPAAGALGQEGTLVLGLGGDVWRWEVQRQRSLGPQALGSTGWNLRIAEYLPNYRQPGSSVATEPGLALELSGRSGSVRFAVAARQPGELFPMGRAVVPWRELPELWCWYHGPDPAYGDPATKAVLQFLPAADGAIHYRSYASARTGRLDFENAGTTMPGAPRRRIWAGMHWKFQVAEYLPRAVPGPHFMPLAQLSTQDSADTTAAIRCRLSHGQSTTEFWLGRSDSEVTTVSLKGTDIEIGYNAAQAELDFALRLVRAVQNDDGGQTSFVLLTDPGRKLADEPRTIALNQPLVQRGYRFYQGNGRFLGSDVHGKPVSRSMLAVQHDPGLWLKYAGSTMVALGIACMFYMRAYLFKARGCDG